MGSWENSVLQSLNFTWVWGEQGSKCSFPKCSFPEVNETKSEIIFFTMLQHSAESSHLSSLWAFWTFKSVFEFSENSKATFTLFSFHSFFWFFFQKSIIILLKLLTKPKCQHMKTTTCSTKSLFAFLFYYSEMSSNFSSPRKI